MNKSLITLCLIALVAQTAFAQAKNGCNGKKGGLCEKCEFDGENKSCEECFAGVRTETAAGSGLYECVGSDARAAGVGALAANLKGANDYSIQRCKKGFTFNFVATSSNTCTTLPDNYEGCLYSKTSAATSNSCQFCSPDYYLMKASVGADMCVKFAKGDKKIKYCAYHEKDGALMSCAVCERGFIEAEGGCKKDIEKSQCLNGGYRKVGGKAACDRCAHLRGWYEDDMVKDAGEEYVRCKKFTPKYPIPEDRFKKEESSSFWMWVIIVLVIIAIGAAAWWFLKGRHSSGPVKGGDYSTA